MSVSKESAQVIRKHPNNTSTSKEIHSFPKQPRFRAPNPECPTHFVDQEYLQNQGGMDSKNNPSKASNSGRAASFGYGGKFDFTRTLPNWLKTPKDQDISQKSFIDLSQGKGKSFGLSAQTMPNNSYLIPQLSKNPSPFHYEINKIKNNDIKYSLRTKPLDFIEAHLTYKQNPAPGHNSQSQRDLNLSNGFKISTKYGNDRLSKFNSHADRFPSIKHMSPVPGPGNYQDNDSMNTHSKYTLSNHYSNGCRQFPKGKRELYHRSNSTISPGPGSYTQLSDFGNYGAGLQTKKYQQLRRGSRLKRQDIKGY